MVSDTEVYHLHVEVSRQFDVSDLLTGPLVVVSDLIQKFTTYWYAGEAMCRIHKFTQVSQGVSDGLQCNVSV